MNTSSRSSAINRRHCIVAVILAVLICGVGVRPCLSMDLSPSWVKDLTPNDKMLLELCKSSDTTPEDIKAILDGKDVLAESRFHYMA